MIADDPANKIKLKTFHCEVLNDHEALLSESKTYFQLPKIETITSEMVLQNFRRIKAEIAYIIGTEIERILNTPGLSSGLK